MRAVPFLRAVFPAFVAALALAGCEDTPPTRPPPPPPAYLVRSTPQNVLSNLEIAYSGRDSIETQALYDPSYVGTSEDLNDPPGTIPSSFTYSDEVSHVATLARTPTISSVTFDLGPSSSWTRLGSSDLSHPEWATIQIAGTSLYIRITESDNAHHVSGASEFFEFVFQPTPDAGSPTDTLWTIVRWRESLAAGP